MKKMTFFLLIFALGALVVNAQTTSDLSRIENAVRQFAGGGDRQDADALDQILHANYRAVINRAMGSADVKLMDKTTYLQMVRDKKLGGDTRQVFMLHTEVVNNMAVVKARFEGKQLRFTTFISLVKLPSGEWQIVGDMPEVEKI